MITKKERDSAKWVRLLEELNEEEFQLAYEIFEKILKLRSLKGGSYEY